MIKILNNLGYQSFNILGVKQYVILLYKFLTSLPSIKKTGNLAPLDKKMGIFSPLNIHHRLGNFKVDISYNDKVYNDGTYAFGAIRELYVRDCYMWNFKNIKASEIKTVVDLGGNRGLFSTLCTPFCEKIVIVEALPILNDLIKYNLNYNGFKNFTIVNKFIGTGGKLFFDGHQHQTISFNELLKESNIEYIDFLKIDIEGGEYTMFKEDIDWTKIKYIAMEIHPNFGDNNIIIDKLTANNFHVTTFTADRELADNVQKAALLYAYNKHLVG